jgi:hypothetical protein
MDRVLSDEEGSSIAWKYGTFSLHARMELTAAWALGPDGWRLDDRRGNADSGTTRTRFRGNPGVTTLFGLPEMSFRVDVESCIMLHDVERGADIFRGSRCSQHWSTSRAGSHPSENHPYPTSPSITQVPAFRISCFRIPNHTCKSIEMSRLEKEWCCGWLEKQEAQSSHNTSLPRHPTSHTLA